MKSSLLSFGSLTDRLQRVRSRMISIAVVRSFINNVPSGRRFLFSLSLGDFFRSEKQAIGHDGIERSNGVDVLFSLHSRMPRSIDRSCL